jgi:hypothetical protein
MATSRCRQERAKPRGPRGFAGGMCRARGKTTQPEVQSRGSMIGPARCSPTQLPYPLNVKCRILDWSTLKDVERDKAMRVRRMRVKRAGDEAAGDTPAILNGHGIASGVDEETGGGSSCTRWQRGVRLLQGSRANWPLRSKPIFADTRATGACDVLFAKVHSLEPGDVPVSFNPLQERGLPLEKQFRN